MSYFGAPDHVAAIMAMVVLSVLLCTAARFWPGTWMTVVSRVLGTALIANEAYYEFWLVSRGGWTAQYDLPFYLCDVAALVAGVALWTRRPLLVEVTYFWALAGTLQGLLTPDSYYAFPTYQYWEFYVDHVGVVVAAFVLVVGQGRYPRPGAALKVFAITAAFTVFVAAADVVTNANYMYLRRVPGTGSMLSLMGPWPWYIASGVVLAGVFLAALDLPFVAMRLRHHRAAASAPAVS